MLNNGSLIDLINGNKSELFFNDELNIIRPNGMYADSFDNSAIAEVRGYCNFIVKLMRYTSRTGNFI